MSPLMRIYDDVGKFNSLSLFSYSSVFNPSKSLVARLRTFSIVSICFILYGFHTALAYSKCGLTRLVYNSLNAFASKYSKLL